MTQPLTEDDKQKIKSSFLIAHDMVLHADDLVGSPNLQLQLDALCTTLAPYCVLSFDKPEIALNLGALHERIGAAYWEKGAYPPEASYHFFDRAADYFRKAAMMIARRDNRFAPARAKLGLSQLYEAGLIGSARRPNKTKAFDYLLAAAHDGLAQAQMFLAFAFFEGRLTSSSITQAVTWINAAHENRDQLDDVQRAGVEEGKEKLEAFFLKTSPLQDPRDRMQALQEARFGVYNLVTGTPQ